MDIFAPLFTVKIGSLTISSTIIFQWAAMLLIIVFALLSTRNLKNKPGKLQVVLESIYQTVYNLVKSNMGESYIVFVPHIGTLAIFLLVLNFYGLIGLAPPTQDLSVAVALAITSFVVVHVNAIRRCHIGGYIKGYFKPYPLMLPLNLMERIIFPVSLALRLFGNMLAATLLIDLMYSGLGHISWFAQLGMPILAHGFFDVFDGTIQMIVFTMLTMVNIKIIADH